MSNLTAEQIQEKLKEPFSLESLGMKPQVVKGDKALAIFYIDARDVMDRLDAVVGVGGWKDSYTPLKDHVMMCELSVKIGDEWITKQDVGGESEQKDVGDLAKSTVSDALKRAAVKFGIGRYLYNIPNIWHSYDPNRKQFNGMPRLPEWAVPKVTKQGGTTPRPADEPTPTKADSEPRPQPTPTTTDNKAPKSGPEIYQRVRTAEENLWREGRCAANEVTNALNDFAVEKKWPPSNKWTDSQIGEATEFVKSTIAAIKQRPHGGTKS